MFAQDAAELTHLAIALGLGLLVGLERERAGKAAGMRSFSMAAAGGFITWKLGLPYAIAALAFIGLVIVMLNIGAIQSTKEVEVTTSVSLFLITLVGMLTAQGYLLISVSVVIFMMILLSWKEEMVVFSRALKRSELHAAVTLGLLSFVILPILPRDPVDPWGIFVPYSVWLMVVLISAIGFVNYILLKLYGGKGVLYTGFLGGLVNSTATAVQLSQTARRGDVASDFVYRGILWSKMASFLRNGLVLAIFVPEALPAGTLPISLMMIVVVALATQWRRGAKERSAPAISLESPFSLKSALQFGLMLAGITVMASIAQELLGSYGFYVVAFFGGMISSASTAATAATLVEAGQITPAVAGAAVLIASIASSIVILPVVWRGSDDPVLVRRIALSVVLIMAAISIGLALNSYFLPHIEAVFHFMNDTMTQ